jgi:hypothetical protein
LVIHLALAGLPAARVLVADALVRDRIAARPVLPDDLARPETTKPNSPARPGGQREGIPSPQEGARRPVVYLYAHVGCAACERAKRDLAAAEKSPTGLPFVVQPAPAPAWVTRFPTFHWNDRTGRGKHVHGWATSAPGPDPVARLIEIWRATQAPRKNATPPPPPPPAEATNRPIRSDGVFYGSVPSLYSWPGDLRDHLAGPPHNLPWTQTRVMTPRELVAAHDGWHLRNR